MRLDEFEKNKLYHGTRLYNADIILSAGKIEPRTSHSFNGEIKHGISTTTNYEFAKAWAGNDPGVVFEFDEQKVYNDFDVRHVDYFKHAIDIEENSEEEEFIITSSPINFETYVKSIIVDKNDWIAFIKQTIEDDNKHVEQMIKHLHQHPKFTLK